jgi:RNA polymerase sigma-70 factor (ECF subfamily)
MATDENVVEGAALTGRTRRADVGRPARLTPGDEVAFNALYEAQAGRAMAVARRVVGDAQLAEDVVHEAFAWAWEHPGQFDAAKGPPEALLLTVVRRRAIDRLRSAARRKQREAQAALSERIESEALQVIAAIDREHLLEEVRRAMEDLRPEQREALELAYFGGLTQQAIAREQNVPTGTVKSRLRAALDRLRKAVGANQL